MRIAIIGRTKFLLDIAKELFKKGYDIPLVITAKEAPEYDVKREDFKNFASSVKAEFISTAKITSEEVKALFEKVGKLDLGVSINYSGIIPQETMDYFNIGILNAHGGDLPKYRGNACQAWAIINGEDKIGMCIHKMIGDELDNGDIIAKDFYPINLNTRIGDYHEWSKICIPKLMIESIEKLKINPNFILETQSKNPKDALRCYPRRPEDGKIEWSKSNIDILRLINASSEPYAGAFCYFEEKKLIIWRADIYEDNEVYLAINGQVAEIKTDGSIIVITGNGKLKITEIEIDGFRCKPSSVIKSIRGRLV